MMSGEPNGLRVSDWNTAPATPSAAPKASAATARGARHWNTMVLSSPSPPPRMTSRTFPGPMG